MQLASPEKRLSREEALGLYTPDGNSCIWPRALPVAPRMPGAQRYPARPITWCWPSSRRSSGVKPTRAPHIEPDSDRCMRQSHNNAVAVSAAKYCPHLSAVESRLSEVGGGTAAAAADLSSRHVESKYFAQKASGGVSVEWKMGFILIHSPMTSFLSPQPPVGPKRSVLMRARTWPRSNKDLATDSTRPVGPQMKIFGLALAGKPMLSSMPPSILRVPPVHPDG